MTNIPESKTRIHDLRRQTNMKQEELTALMGARRETIGNLEMGNTIHL